MLAPFREPPSHSNTVTVKLYVIAVGQRMPAWITAGYEEYAKRMPREARLTLLEVKAEKREGGKPLEHALAAEAGRIEAALPDNAEVIVLTERGTSLSTKQLADWLRAFMATGRDAAFVIGGADGLHPRLDKRADRTLSISGFTLPHGLARVLLVEQLYRAMSLIRHHPYHRQ